MDTSYVYAVLYHCPRGHDFPAAQSQGVWRVENKLVGKDDKKAEDVSGIACVHDTSFPWGLVGSY